MEIALKNVKYHPDMSEETNCFSATIYVDGKKAGTVKNNGKGGCHDYYWDDFKFGRQVEEWASKQDMEFQFEKLDQLINDLLEAFVAEQNLKRWMRTNLVFKLKGTEKGSWSLIKKAPDAEAWARKKYGDKIQVIVTPENLAQVAAL